MLLLIHLVAAFSSIVWATYLYIRPSRHKFHVAYGLTAATVVSGVCLVISTHSPLLSSCVAGLAYLAMAAAALIFAYRKLAGSAC